MTTHAANWSNRAMVSDSRILIRRAANHSRSETAWLSSRAYLMQSPSLHVCNLEAVDERTRNCKDPQHTNSPNGLFPNDERFAKDASEEINTNQQNHEGNIILVG